MATKIFGKITVIKRNGSCGSQFPVTGSTCTFGRESDCEIRIQLPAVSSHECQLKADENGRFVVSKLNEKGEVLVNKKSLGTQAIVNHNDVLTIAGRSFRFEYPPPQREKMATVTGKPPVGTPRPSVLERLRQTEKRRVSFGPQLSPEQFDLALPPNTPVKKGAIPMKNLSNTDDIDRRRSLVKTQRKNVEKSVSPVTTKEEKEKKVKKRSFDKLVELVGLGKPEKTEPNQAKSKTPLKASTSDQLDFFGAIKNTPKTVDDRRTSLVKPTKSDDSRQNETSASNEATPLAKTTCATLAQKRRSGGPKNATPTVEEVSDLSAPSKTPEKKKRKSIAATPKPLDVQTSLDDEAGMESFSKRRSSSKFADTVDNVEANDGVMESKTPVTKKRRSKIVTPRPSNTVEESGAEKLEDSKEKRKSMKMVNGDLDDTLPVETEDPNYGSPAQSVTLATQDIVNDEAVMTPTLKKRRSKVATPQQSSGSLENTIGDAAQEGAVEVQNDHSDVIPAGKNEPITAKQKRKSMSTPKALKNEMEVGKPGTPKTQTPKAEVQVASEEAALQESAVVTPGLKRRSTSKSVTPKSIKKAESRKSSSAVVTPRVTKICTSVENLAEQRVGEVDDAISTDDTLPVDDHEDNDSKKIILIVQEQTPAKQPDSTSQSPDMTLEIDVETPGVPTNKKTPRSSRRSEALRSETPSLKAHSQTPASRRRKSKVMDVAMSLRGIPFNSAVLTARRKSLRRRKSGLLLWSDVVRKNTAKKLESKTELVQLQKVMKTARRPLSRTPKQAQNLRHIDSPATIYIGKKTRPRRSFAAAALDMTGDWTSDNGNKTVEDSFVLSQRNTDKFDEAGEVKTPKVKGQPVEDHFGTKRLLKTPKEKVKGQPVEEHFGTKRLLKTPKDKFKGQPVEEHLGTKRLLKTPNKEVKSQPVEKHFGTKRLLQTPKDKVKGQPVEEHFGTKRLLRTPVDKVKGKAVDDEFGTKRLFYSPKVKGEQVEYNFGMKRLLSTRERKEKNEAVEDDFNLEQIFGYEADVDEKASNFEESQQKRSKTTSAEKERAVERVKTRTRKSERNHSTDTESDSNERKSKNVTKPTTAEKERAVERVNTRTRKQSSDNDSDLNERKATTVDKERAVGRVNTRTRKSKRNQSSDTESDTNERRSTRHSKAASTIENTLKKRKQSEDSDSSEPTRKKRDTAVTKKRRSTRGTVSQEDSNQTNSGAKVETQTRSDQAKEQILDETPKPKAVLPKTKLTAIPEVDEPTDADCGVENNSSLESLSGEQKQDAVEHEQLLVGKTTATTTSKVTSKAATKRTAKTQDKTEAAEKPKTPKTKSLPVRTTRKRGKESETDEAKPKNLKKAIKKQLDNDVIKSIKNKAAKQDVNSDSISEKAADTKPAAVRSSRRSKAVRGNPDTRDIESSDAEKAKKKRIVSKKTEDVKTEVAQPTRTTRRVHKIQATPALNANELSTIEPANKKAKISTKEIKGSTRRTTKPRNDGQETEKQTTAARKRKTSDGEAVDTKPLRSSRSSVAVAEPARKSSRVRNGK